MANFLSELEITAKKQKKKPRAERNEEVKLRLFQAASKIVGRRGYAEASVARITQLAGYAQGTFYNHFTNRQELLDNLLPILGRQMVEFIEARVDRNLSEADRESARLRAFFEFLIEMPEFLRILNEAEFFAPAGYERHLQTVAADYVRTFKRGKLNDRRLAEFSDAELEVVVHILLGARSYLGQRYCFDKGTVHPIPEHVMSSYIKLLNGGLFEQPAAKG